MGERIPDAWWLLPALICGGLAWWALIEAVKGMM